MAGDCQGANATCSGWHTSFGRADRAIRRQFPNSFSTRYSRLSVVPKIAVPFTISHAAAVLPLHRSSKHQLPLTALMIGSMAPDFGYFFSHEASRQLTHSLSGLFIFALPVGLFVWLFYVAILEKATITLLSDRWHTRFAHTDAITTSLVARASIAIVLGAATHLLWDAFTHRGTFVTDAFPALLGPTPGIGWMPIYHFLHGLSSVVGLVLLAAWARALHRMPARSLIRPYKISERARSVRCGSCWLLRLVGGSGTGCRMRNGVLRRAILLRGRRHACRDFSSRGVASRSPCGSTRGGLREVARQRADNLRASSARADVQDNARFHAARRHRSDDAAQTPQMNRLRPRPFRASPGSEDSAGRDGRADEECDDSESEEAAGARVGKGFRSGVHAYSAGLKHPSSPRGCRLPRHSVSSAHRRAPALTHPDRKRPRRRLGNTVSSPRSRARAGACTIAATSLDFVGAWIRRARR